MKSDLGYLRDEKCSRVSSRRVGRVFEAHRLRRGNLVGLEDSTHPTTDEINHFGSPLGASPRSNRHEIHAGSHPLRYDFLTSASAAGSLVIASFDESQASSFE